MEQASERPTLKEWTALVGCILAIVGCALAIVHRVASQPQSSTARTARNNATIEATAAAQRLWGRKPAAVYCRFAKNDPSIDVLYPGGGNICDVYIPGEGTMRLYCDVQPYRDNRGCTISTISSR